MMENLRSLWLAFASGLAALALIMAVGCGDDDNDSAAGSGGAAGSTAGTGGAAGSTGGTSGAGTGGAGGFQIPDGGFASLLPEGTVEEGGDCAAGLLGNRGTCVAAGGTCEGGTATDMITGFTQGAALPITMPEFMDQGDCVAGLICCIRTDECVAFGAEVDARLAAITIPLIGGFLGPMLSGATYSCVPDGTCTGEISVPTGCTSGNVCCVDQPDPPPQPDAGPRDGGGAGTGGAGGTAGMGGFDGGAAGTPAAGTGGSEAGTGGSEAGAGGSEAGAGGSEAGAGGSEAGEGGTPTTGGTGGA